MNGTIEIYRGDSCENIIPLDQDEIKIGRDRFNRICLPTLNVSRYHARLIRREDAIYIEDASSNGTHINGEILRRGRSQRLHHGAVLTIGDYRLYYNALGNGIDSRATHTDGKTSCPRNGREEFLLRFLQVARDPVKIRGTYFTIGSDERNHVCLGGEGIEGLHASITVLGKTPYLQSYHNETFINGVRIERMPMLLSHGDIVTIGRLKFIFTYVPAPQEHHKFKIITQSPLMKELIDQIERTAKFPDVPVLIIGETGTGKELVAEGIHAVSPRAYGSFVPVNCAALSPTLAESLLFGHVKGSFTSALQDHDGYFKSAHGGTLFLDEIGELLPELQSKLLRAIEYKQICKVGSSEIENIDIRVVAATNRHLNDTKTRQQSGFREDLYYRLRGFELLVPHLRNRRKDIPLLMEHFLQISKVKYPSLAGLRFTTNAFKMAMFHDWPGNVRELFQACLGAFLHANDAFINELPIFSSGSDNKQRIMIPLKLRNIYDMLNSDMSHSEIARKINISRTTLYKWKYEIESIINQKLIEPSQPAKN